MKLNFKKILISKVNLVFITVLLSIFSGWLIINSVLSSGSSAAEKKRPSIYFPVTSHDFGQVTGGKTVTHKFVFYNKGSEVLLIDKLSAG